MQSVTHPRPVPRWYDSVPVIKAVQAFYDHLRSAPSGVLNPGVDRARDTSARAAALSVPATTAISGRQARSQPYSAERGKVICDARRRSHANTPPLSSSSAARTTERRRSQADTPLTSRQG